MKTIKTQDKEWFLNRLLEEKVYNTANAQELLSMGKAEFFGECDKYFFKEVMDCGRWKEIRLHKKSNRITVSENFTK
jgi:hypothetical protein